MRREGERGDKRVGGNRMRRRGWERMGVREGRGWVGVVIAQCRQE